MTNPFLAHFVQRKQIVTYCRWRPHVPEIWCTVCTSNLLSLQCHFVKLYIEHSIFVDLCHHLQIAKGCHNTFHHSDWAFFYAVLAGSGLVIAVLKVTLWLHQEYFPPFSSPVLVSGIFFAVFNCPLNLHLDVFPFFLWQWLSFQYLAMVTAIRSKQSVEVFAYFDFGTHWKAPACLSYSRLLHLPLCLCANFRC